MVERPNELEFEPRHLISCDAGSPLKDAESGRDMVGIELASFHWFKVGGSYLMKQPFQAGRLDFLKGKMNCLKRGARPVCFKKPVDHFIYLWRILPQRARMNLAPILFAYF